MPQVRPRATTTLDSTASFGRTCSGGKLLQSIGLAWLCSPAPPQPALFVTSDASGGWGCGACSGTGWFQLEWPTGNELPYIIQGTLPGWSLQPCGAGAGDSSCSAFGVPAPFPMSESVLLFRYITGIRGHSAALN